MAFDPVRGKVVLFGGYFNASALRDLWEWDGDAGTWTNRTPTAISASWPASRMNHALVWDPARKRLVLFGGDNGRGAWSRELWEWDGDAGEWMNRTPMTIAQPWPERRWGAAMAADEGRGRLVLFGGGYAASDPGVSGTPFGDTWEWDGNEGAWTARTPTPVPAEWPSARVGAALTWDGSRRKVVMVMGVGGGTGILYDSGVWEWDGAAGLWRRTTPEPTPSAWPNGRQDHGCVWDGARDVLLLFGGRQDGVSNAGQRDVWQFDRAAGAWTDRTLPEGSAAWPKRRRGHAMVFDGRRGRVLLFGGISGVAIAGENTDLETLGDSWEWQAPPPI